MDITVLPMTGRYRLLLWFQMGQCQFELLFKTIHYIYRAMSTAVGNIELVSQLFQRDRTGINLPIDVALTDRIAYTDIHKIAMILQMRIIINCDADSSKTWGKTTANSQLCTQDYIFDCR